MLLPDSYVLARRHDLAPILEIAEHLAIAIAAVEQHERKAVVKVQYNVLYDEETEQLHLCVQVKSKRPVRSNRNEEVIGEETTIFSLSRKDEHGQQRLPGVDEAARVLREADQKLKAAGATMTVKSADGTEASIGAKPAAPTAPAPATAAAVSRPFLTGELVQHSVFGIGTVVKVAGGGEAKAVTVDFADHGRKELQTAFAKGRLEHVEVAPPPAAKKPAKGQPKKPAAKKPAAKKSAKAK